MDERQFDAWAARYGAANRSRRQIVQFITLGFPGLAGLGLGATGIEAKKKKKKKKCKRTLDTCSGAKKCCSKRCCTSIGGFTHFCGPSGSTCCPTGGACAAETPVCCDATIGPAACTTSTFPVCCFANSVFTYDYGCPAGTVCCDDLAAQGCCVPGTQRTKGGFNTAAAPLAPIVEAS